MKHAWFVELKRRGKYQLLLQVAFWTVFTAWCAGFAAIASRLLQDQRAWRCSDAGAGG
jgi:hypothetical protein